MLIQLILCLCESRKPERRDIEQKKSKTGSCTSRLLSSGAPPVLGASCGFSMFLLTMLRAIAIRSVSVGDARCDWASTACAATGNIMASVLSCLIVSVFLKRAASSLANFGSCVFSSEVDSSRFPYHRLSMIQ